LATCAAAAPLIGLLGTVWGLVSVFGSIDADSAAADAMRHGLRVALLTTEVGLACAIPALGAHAWLSRALTRRLAAIEAAR
jgi:biopolymer transport protein ExbB/TolQ